VLVVRTALMGKKLDWPLLTMIIYTEVPFKTGLIIFRPGIYELCPFQIYFKKLTKYLCRATAFQFI